MYQEDFKNTIQIAKGKVNFLSSNPLGYLIASLLAGMFVSFGGFVTFTIGAYLTQAGYAPVKFVMAFSFASALSLVMMAGSELFTGNNFVMGVGILSKEVSWKTAWKLWGVTYIGNWIGSILAVALFYFTRVPEGVVGEFFAEIARGKVMQSPDVLFVKGILCNILVCLAVWCGVRMKSESGKLIMVFWCIYIFMLCGFEHSVANMATILMGMLYATNFDISISAYLYNLVFVTAGNIVGGVVFVALPYYLISKPVKNCKN